MRTGVPGLFDKLSVIGFESESVTYQVLLCYSVLPVYMEPIADPMLPLWTTLVSFLCILVFIFLFFVCSFSL